MAGEAATRRDMRVLIADDHALVRETIARFLEAEGMAVATAETLDDALERIAAEGPFDLVLLDYSMPGMDGLAGLGEARDAAGGRPVALMSGTAARAVAEAALDAGAAGFVPKTLAAGSMANAVRFMVSGERFAPVQWMTGAEGEPAAHPAAAQLSSREREVLAGLCEGSSNKEIARALSLQEVTVKLHVKTLCRKLSARNRTHAAMIAKDAGLI